MPNNEAHPYTEINIVNEPTEADVPAANDLENNNTNDNNAATLTSTLSSTANTITSSLRNTFSGIPLPSFSLFGNSSTTNSTSTNPNSDVIEEENIDTLEEPVYKTIGRELYGIGRKTALVLIPKPTSMNELRNWDLWGPFFLCLSICVFVTTFL